MTMLRLRIVVQNHCPLPLLPLSPATHHSVSLPYNGPRSSFRRRSAGVRNCCSAQSRRRGWAPASGEGEEEGKGKSDCGCGDSVHDTLMAIGESIHKVLGELWNGCPERSRGTTRSRWLQLGTRTRRFGTRRCRRLDGLRSRWRWMRRPPRKNGLEKLFENIVGDGAAAKDQRKGNGKQRRDE